jgi:hypothetical protein
VKAIDWGYAPPFSAHVPWGERGAPVRFPFTLLAVSIKLCDWNGLPPRALVMKELIEQVAGVGFVAVAQNLLLEEVAGVLLQQLT